MEIRQAIDKLVNGIDLSEAETVDVMNQIMTGEATPLQVAAVLTALRMKGETVEEITGAARVMREKAHRVNVGKKTVLDTCGTGGDQKGTFNISTTAAFVLAGAGVNVAKHGNRSVSSQSGSADVLGALGVKVDAPKERVEQCIATIGIGFLFAPLLHEAMKYAVQPRRDIGIRTIFNILGPLTNPAMATHQLIGIYNGKLLAVIAHVLKNLGSARAMVVHGLEGLDEISLCGDGIYHRTGAVRPTTLRSGRATRRQRGAKRDHRSRRARGSKRSGARCRAPQQRRRPLRERQSRDDRRRNQSRR
jgi:anthranilate phosphoribosyltransferase